MESKIQEELDGRKPAEVPELILDNCKSDNIVGLTDQFENLEYLSINNCGLTALKGFPALPNLKRLELMDNAISGGLSALSGCKNMTHLNLSGNKIKELEVLSDLKDLTHLKSLDLFNCEVSSLEGYRERVFETLSHLQYLDGYDKEGAQAEDSEDELNGDAEDDEDEDEGDDDEVGLDYLASEQVEDEDETEDFAPGDGEGEDEEEEDEVDDDDGEDGTGDAPTGNGDARGVKRKHDEEEETN